MFERYTEKARRIIFFARYEASHFGSSHIETEHILLGLTREDKRIHLWLPRAHSLGLIREQIESWMPKGPKISTAVDLPLSDASKRVLHRAKDEADRLNSRHIGTEHLFLALLQEEDSTAKLLLRLGADLEKSRVEFGKQMQEPYEASVAERIRERLLESSLQTIMIHGTRRSLTGILEIVTHHRKQNCHWVNRSWAPRDAVAERKTGKVSLDLSLADDAARFEVIKGGWKKDYCAICRWELFESKDDAHHGIGYTNGRDWVCTECFERFWDRPDFIAGSYSEIT